MAASSDASGAMEGSVGALVTSFSPDPCDNGDEDMMQDFVRLHMISILQPFAAGVQELRDKVEQLTGDLYQGHEAGNRHESRLDRLEQQLLALQASTAEAREWQGKVQVELASARKEKNRLDGNHEMTKASLGKTKETIGDVSSSVEALQQLLKDSTDRIGNLERGLIDSEKKVTELLEARLNRQGKVCKDLGERQADISKLCEQAKTLAQNANASIKRLTNSSESHQQEDVNSFASLREWVTNLESKLQDVARDLHQQSENTTSTYRDVQHLKTWTEQLVDVKQLHAQQLETISSLQAQSQQLERAEMDITQMKNDAITERQLQNVELNNLEQRIQQNLSDVIKWKDTQKAHYDLISSTGRRLSELESGQIQLTERSDTSERKLQSLDSWRHDATEKLASHESGLDSVRSDLLHTYEGIESASAGLRSLRSERCDDHELLEKLGSRLELCHKYFSGLGKGLQDTRRQIVNGDTGMLPSKTGGALLPAIPQSPRTARASLTSPRKLIPLDNRQA